MLYIVGTGLYGWKETPFEGIEACKNAEKVYLDSYTRNFDPKELEEFSSYIGKPIHPLVRKELEETLPFIEDAKTKDIVLLVPGDPLVATTHITIVETLRKREIPFKVIHAASIYSAFPGEAGLQVYKMGGSVTIPSPEKQIKPYSTYDKIKENRRLGYHTLVLLDTAPEGELSPGKGLSMLLEIEDERRENICTRDTWVIVGCKLGAPDQRIVYMSVKDIIESSFNGPCTLIFPGKLHFMEEDFLELIKRDSPL